MISDKNIDYLLNKIRSLEEEIRRKDSKVTYNGVPIEYVADKVLEEAYKKSDDNILDNSSTFIMLELTRRKKLRIKVIEA